MAEIEIDIKLPSAEATDIDSPYAPQDANITLSNVIGTNVEIIEKQSDSSVLYIAGPQGATGPVGPSGAQGPSGLQGLTGPQGPSGEINTGELDLRYYSINNPSGFITGVDLSNYVTKINGQFNDRPTVNGTGVLLSGEAANVDLSSTVQITGDQNISGIKNFYSRPTVNGTGVLLSGEAAGGGNLEKRHDFVTGSPYDYSYCGTAPENSLENASVWNITRLSIDSAGVVAFNQSVTNYSWTGRYLAPYA
jgi:hypothetical protein